LFFYIAATLGRGSNTHCASSYPSEQLIIGCSRLCPIELLGWRTRLLYISVTHVEGYLPGLRSWPCFLASTLHEFWGLDKLTRPIWTNLEFAQSRLMTLPIGMISSHYVSLPPCEQRGFWSGDRTTVSLLPGRSLFLNRTGRSCQRLSHVYMTLDRCQDTLLITILVTEERSIRRLRSRLNTTVDHRV
jgi:hypothetical protein